MLETFLIFGLGLLPPLLSIWAMRYAEVQAQERLRLAMNPSQSSRIYAIGDISCQFNARSRHLRCAVNPSGPCQECPHYQSIDIV